MRDPLWSIKFVLAIILGLTILNYALLLLLLARGLA